MSFIWKKGRKREYNGRLRDFEALTPKAKATFKDIKVEILDALGEDTITFVYGSHYWGYADNGSDFDVRVNKLDKKLIKLSKTLTIKLGVDVHLMFVEEKRLDEEGVIIPN